MQQAEDFRAESQAMFALLDRADRAEHERRNDGCFKTCGQIHSAPSFAIHKRIAFFTPTLSA